jgi:tetratricopeptide (TPR) repeat protein
MRIRNFGGKLASMTDLPDDLVLADALEETQQESTIVELINQKRYEEALTLASKLYKTNQQEKTSFKASLCTYMAIANLFLKHNSNAEHFGQLTTNLAFSHSEIDLAYKAIAIVALAKAEKHGQYQAEVYLSKWLEKYKVQPALYAKLAYNLQETFSPLYDASKFASTLSIYCTELSAKYEPDPLKRLERKLYLATERRNFEEIQQLTRQILEIDSQNETAYRSLINIYIAGKKWAELKAVAENLLSKNPKDPSALWALCKVFVAEGKLAEAQKLGEELVKNPLTKLMTLEVLVEIAFAQYGPGPELFKAATELLNAVPNSFIAKEYLARFYICEKNWPKALETVQELFRRNPENQTNLFLMAFCHSGLGNDQQALHFAILCDKNPGGVPLDGIQQVAAIFYNAGKFDLSFQWAQKALSNDPDNLTALIIVSESAMEIGQTELALEYAQKLLTLDPDNECALWTVGNLLANSNRLEEAEQVALKAQSKFPTESYGQFLLSVIYLKQGQKELARKHLDQLKSLDSKDDYYSSMEAIFQDQFAEKSNPAETLQSSLQPANQQNSEPAQLTTTPPITHIIPVRRRKKNVNSPSPLAAAPASPRSISSETRARTVLATETHEQTQQAWENLVAPVSEKCFKVSGDKGFDFACMRKDQLLLAEIKSINTSRDNERAEMLLAMGQIDLYSRTYIKTLPERAGKILKKVIVLSHRPQFLDDAAGILLQAVQDAETEGAYFVLWFENGEVKGSEKALQAYEDYLTC